MDNWKLITLYRATILMSNVFLFQSNMPGLQISDVSQVSLLYKSSETKIEYNIRN